MAAQFASAYRWLEDALRAAKDWQTTDAPPAGPPYLSDTTCENLRTSVRTVRRKRRDIQRTTEDLQAAGNAHRELRAQMDAGPVGRGHRGKMRNLSSKVERLRVLLAGQEESLAESKALLQTRAQCVRRAIEAAEAKARPQPLARTRAEAQAEGVATKKAKAEAARIKAKAEQEHADALLSLEIARKAPQRVKAKAVATIRAAVPKGCANCANSRPLAQSDTGHDCLKGWYRICEPWTGEPKKWAQR